MVEGPKYAVQHAVGSAIGDNAFVLNRAPAEDELGGLVRVLLERIQALPPGDREQAAMLVGSIEQNVRELPADGDSEVEAALEGRLQKLLELAADIGDVALAALANPIAGVASAARKIAQRLRVRGAGESRLTAVKRVSTESSP